MSSIVAGTTTPGATTQNSCATGLVFLLNPSEKLSHSVTYWPP